eukprot:CAMPEP_0115877268 /NCGR_PEP_ID=MMETSP0287-20121206/26129_1 /TAXON_ID=412157 /ORGANISM="Chrysochromulina rotalis, Strain UIO044" /LENGTH=53 /DNA_ID=CAMNT_0003332765 /DNA_START=186 /DNA_END=344 /DNA_ORIENTATION=+
MASRAPSLPGSGARLPCRIGSLRCEPCVAPRATHGAIGVQQAKGGGALAKGRE